MINIRYIFLILVVSSIAACELTVNVDLPEHEPKLVVNARLNADRPVLVEVTKSKSILSDSLFFYEVIKDAQVLIVKDQVDTFQFSYNVAVGSYVNSQLISANPGSTYRIFVSHPDFESVSAQSTVPIPVEIKNVEIEKDVETDVDGNTLSLVRFEVEDPPNDQNYYSLLLGLVDSSNVSFSICYQTSDPVLSGRSDPFDNQSRPEYCGGEKFTDELMTGSPYEMEIFFIDDYFREVDSFFIRLTTFDEASYLYERSLQQQQNNTGNPFAEPVIVYNNIENGLGNFGGRVESEIRVKW